MKDFKDRILSLESVWEHSFSENFPQEVVPEAINQARRSILSSSKSAKTTLLVRFPDGTVISRLKAAETFALVLKRIGFDRVSTLGKVVNGEPIIADTPSKKYNDTPMDGSFVKTHSSTAAKKRQLQEISDALDCGLSVQIVN